MNPHITSIGVCHNLSFSLDFLCSLIKKFSCRSLLIAFKYSACFHVWYLKFIASYAKSIEKVKAIAKDTLRIQSANNAKTVTLLATQVWKEGNPPEMKMWLRQILFSTIESIIILTNCIITPTRSTMNIGGILSGKESIKLCRRSTI